MSTQHEPSSESAPAIAARETAAAGSRSPADAPWWDAHWMLALRRRAKYLRVPLLAAVDRGWLGLTPLRVHVVVCGFPRSGSTLLQLMAESCVADAKVFGRELLASEVARFALRNHAFMISKRPNDLFEIDALRRLYAGRRARVHFVLTRRDPRAVLTSRHQGSRGRYYVPCERWRRMDAAFQRQAEADDVSVVDLAELVTAPEAVERRLTERVGWELRRPFREFHAAAPPGFEGAALGGVRPLDPRVLDRWRDPAHRERIQRVLASLLELPARLVELGYEPDDAWTRAYR